MPILTIDVETLPTDRTDVIESLKANIKPPATYKKPESIAQWMTENMEAEIDAAHRKTALDGAFGRVCVIGFAIDDEPVKTLSGSEQEVLQAFADVLSSGDFDRYQTKVVGHHVAGFDLRFLVQRYIVNSIRVPSVIRYAADAKPWEQDKVFDTMVQWAGVGNRISLDRLCMALSIPTPKGELTGSNVYDYFLEGRIGEIEDYCRKDVEATRQVYKRMTFQ
jgi:hypothetical protein